MHYSEIPENTLTQISYERLNSAQLLSYDDASLSVKKYTSNRVFV